MINGLNEASREKKSIFLISVSLPIVDHFDSSHMQL